MNTALVGKLTEDRLLRARKLCIDTTVVEDDIDHPTDADLLEHGVRKLSGLVRRIKAAGAARQDRVPGPQAARPGDGSSRSAVRYGAALGRR